MSDRFSREELLLGRTALERLKASRVAVFGAGGVGGYAIEALARGGVGALDIFDDDRVSLTDINRQLYATEKTLGRYKADVAAERVLDINPAAKVNAQKLFFLPETADRVDFTQYDYVVDAIDTVAGKIEIVLRAQAAHVPVVSCMGAGNKTDATAFEVADLFRTSVCPLARTMRSELKKRGVTALKVVYSKEPPLSPAPSGEASPKRQVPGSLSFVPSVAGLILAGEVLKDLAAAPSKP